MFDLQDTKAVLQSGCTILHPHQQCVHYLWFLKCWLLGPSPGSCIGRRDQGICISNKHWVILIWAMLGNHCSGSWVSPPRLLCLSQLTVLWPLPSEYDQNCHCQFPVTSYQTLVNSSHWVSTWLLTTFSYGAHDPVSLPTAYWVSQPDVMAPRNCSFPFPRWAGWLHFYPVNDAETEMSLTLSFS